MAIPPASEGEPKLTKRMAKKIEEAKDVEQTDIAVAPASEGEATDSGILVRDPEDFRPKVLPLIITFPEGYNPSKEQVRLAKVFNGFAYQFPDKWKIRKDELLKQLEDAKNAPDPVENPDVHISVGPKAPVNIL